MSENVSQDKSRVIAEALDPDPTWPELKDGYEPDWNFEQQSAGGLWYRYGYGGEGRGFLRGPFAADLGTDPAAMVALKETCWKVRRWVVNTGVIPSCGMAWCEIEDWSVKPMCRYSLFEGKTEMLAVRDAVYAALSSSGSDGEE